MCCLALRRKHLTMAEKEFPSSWTKESLEVASEKLLLFEVISRNGNPISSKKCLLRTMLESADETERTVRCWLCGPAQPLHVLATLTTEKLTLQPKTFPQPPCKPGARWQLHFLW